MVRLPPLQHPIGVFDKYMAHDGETLILKEKLMSLSGDSFEVNGVTGQAIFKVQGRHLTTSGRKSVKDMAGNHLFDIVKKHMHIHSTYAVEDPQGKNILEVKSSFKRTCHPA